MNGVQAVVSDRKGFLWIEQWLIENGTGKKDRGTMDKLTHKMSPFQIDHRTSEVSGHETKRQKIQKFRIARAPIPLSQGRGPVQMSQLEVETLISLLHFSKYSDTFFHRSMCVFLPFGNIG